jgi:hypothetical protein
MVCCQYVCMVHGVLVACGYTSVRILGADESIMAAESSVCDESTRMSPAQSPEGGERPRQSPCAASGRRRGCQRAGRARPGLDEAAEAVASLRRPQAQPHDHSVPPRNSRAACLPADI